MKARIVLPAYRDRYGHDHKAGDVCEYPDHLALKLIRLGYVEAVREAPVERAVQAPPENTAKHVSKPKSKPKPREGARKRTFSSPKE